VRSAFTALAIELRESRQLVDEFRELLEDPDRDQYLRNPATFRR